MLPHDALITEAEASLADEMLTDGQTADDAARHIVADRMTTGQTVGRDAWTEVYRACRALERVFPDLEVPPLQLPLQLPSESYLHQQFRRAVGHRAEVREAVLDALVAGVAACNRPDGDELARHAARVAVGRPGALEQAAPFMAAAREATTQGTLRRVRDELEPVAKQVWAEVTEPEPVLSDPRFVTQVACQLHEYGLEIRLGTVASHVRHGRVSVSDVDRIFATWAALDAGQPLPKVPTEQGPYEAARAARVRKSKSVEEVS